MKSRNSTDGGAASGEEDDGTKVASLANGVRVVVIPLPYMATVAVSAFVRSGSLHEDARTNGIGHFIEHMAFKGTRSRDCQAINLDAERLGAEVNAHTDKDHTAFHMRGLGRDAAAFVDMLGDIVLHSTFPEGELARERQVILQEFAEDEDDAMAAAFKLFDAACYGDHPAGRPVSGTRANLQAFTRSELADWVRGQYTGVNTIVGVIGDVDPDTTIEAAAAAFGAMPAGSDNRVSAPTYVGGVRQRRVAGSDQADVIIGFPIPALLDAHEAFVVAAALLGEGMSSPLLDQLRERRGLVYHADCWADVRETYGQFVIEASLPRARLREYFEEIARLLRQHAGALDAVGLERAQNQIAVRVLADHESPTQRLEAAALDLFAFGHVRSTRALLARYTAVDADRVREAFARMFAARPAIAIAGDIARGEAERLARCLVADDVRRAPTRRH